MKKMKRKRLITTLLIAIFILSITAIAISIAPVSALEPILVGSFSKTYQTTTTSMDFHLTIGLAAEADFWSIAMAPTYNLFHGMTPGAFLFEDIQFGSLSEGQTYIVSSVSDDSDFDAFSAFLTNGIDDQIWEAWIWPIDGSGAGGMRCAGGLSGFFFESDVFSGIDVGTDYPGWTIQSVSLTFDDIYTVHSGDFDWLTMDYTVKIYATVRVWIDENEDGIYDNGESAFYTIQDAIDAANPGDTIIVAAGTYTEYLHITTDFLTIEGAGIDQSIIDLDGLTPYWHYPGSSSFASRAGVLISGYGSLDEIVEGVTFRGFTVQNAGLNPPTTATGTHTGTDDIAVLTDSSTSWTPGALVGEWVHNYGDRDTDYKPARSYGQITANTATTVTATLSGGVENDWDSGDEYLITPYQEFHNSFWVHYPNYDGIRCIGIGNGKDILIQNCKVTDSGYGGITVGLARCVSEHKYSEGVTIDNCISSDHPVAGINVGKYYKGPVTITNNLCERNKRPAYDDPTREYSGFGIQVQGNWVSDPVSGVISDNICRDNGFEGIILAKYTDGVVVEDNTVTGHNFDQDGAGIFMYHYNEPELCTNHVVRNNVVTGNIRGICAYYASYCTIEGNEITTDSGSFPEGQAAIKIDGGNNIEVKDNTISCDGVGIKVQKTWNDVDCYHNTFTDNIITGAKFAGIFISHGAHDNTFTGNIITGTTSLTRWAGEDYEETQGDGVFLWGYPEKEAGTGNVFHLNNIYGNADDGMENQITTTVDATLNWWGHSSGPYNSTTNPDGIGNKISDHVDYSPWLGFAVGTSPMTHHVNPTGTIQSAIDASDPGDTITVHPGTYHETHEHGPGGGVAVDIPWFAEGAGGLTIMSSDGAENTIIDCNTESIDPSSGCAASGVKIVSNDITFSGFTVKNAYTAVGQVSAKGHKLSNLIITDFVNVGLELMAVHNCEFSDITIHTNDVSESEDRTVKGIDMQEYGSGGNTNNHFEDITIYDIETTGTFGTSMGIFWEGDNQATHPTTGNTFTDLTIYDMTGPWIGAGVYMYGQDSSQASIEDTKFSGGNIHDCSSIGIYVLGGCKDLSISGFDITNNGKHGIGIRHYYGTVCENVDINFNNIVGNTEYGVKDYDGDNDVDATHNWWGDASGPYHPILNPEGLGDAVSDNVDFDPWIGAGVEESTTEEVPEGETSYEVELEDEASILVDKEEGSTPTVTVAKYEENPDTGFTGDVGEYIDVYVPDVSGVNEIEIRLYYTDAEITALGLEESSLTMNWWDGTEWIPCSDTGVNIIENYIWARIRGPPTPTTPSLDDLTGTPFGGKGQPPPQPVGGEIVTPNIPALLTPYLLTLLGMAGIVSAYVFAWRKRWS